MFIEGFTLGILSATLAQPLTTGLPEFRDAASAPNKRPRLAIELRPKGTAYAVDGEREQPVRNAIRALPYPR